MQGLNIRKGAEALAKWSAIAIGFSVPISTALDNILLFVILVFWLVSAGFMQKLATIRTNPVALAALALFGLLIVGCSYGQGTSTDALNYLGKYLDVLFIPILIFLFKEEKARRFGILGFMLAMALTLILSYATKIGLLSHSWLIQGTADNPYVFRMHITQNIFMAFFAYLLAMKARYAESPRLRLAFALASALAACNILFMVQGRTGYVVLAALMVYFCFDWLGRKGFAVALGVLLVVGVAGYYGADTMRKRINLAATEIAAWQPGQGAVTSAGLRMDYYTNSLAIIRDHPLFGVGTGGFEKAYGEKIRNTAVASSNNPHNQYLLITVQLGVLGLGLLLYLFFTQWRMAGLLPTALEQNLARGMLLTIASGSLFNSLLLDHSEGLFFAWMSGVLFAGLSTAQKRTEDRN